MFKSRVLAFLTGVVLGMIFWAILGYIIHDKSYENGKADHQNYQLSSPDTGFLSSSLTDTE